MATDARGEMLENDKNLNSLQKWLFHFSLLTNFCVTGVLMWFTVCLGQKNKASGICNYNLVLPNLATNGISKNGGCLVKA